MKKYILPFFVLFLLFSACDENMPEIACLSCEDDELPPEPQDRVVLVEEFTGVRCINCPAGSAELENLLSVYGDQLVAVSIHAEFFANPYPQSQYDFQTPEGDFIISLVGLPEAYPSAVVDRKQFTGESDLQLVGQGSWAGKIAEQLDGQAKISLNINNTYDDASRNLSVNVSGDVFEAVDEEVRLTIMITETGIVDHQLTPNSSPDTDPDYVHKHVLRKVITAFDGDVVTNSAEIGDVIDEVYSYTLPDEWNAAGCEVIAFLHLNSSSKEILQAAEEHLTD